MYLEPNIFFYFNKCCYIIIIWLYSFSSYTILRFIFKLLTNPHKFIYGNLNLINYKENLILEELPGLSFILLHTLCFYVANDFITKIYFVYWGPLYIVTAYLVVFKKNINWKSIAIISSYSCKFFYVFYVAIFLYFKLYLPIYCYSIWIMHDQVKLLWLKNNADRTRRLFEDYFIFRVGYPLFLLLPFIIKDFYFKYISMCCSIGILILWITGIYRLVILGKFFEQPKIEGFGRDIVYL